MRKQAYFELSLDQRRAHVASQIDIGTIFGDIISTEEASIIPVHPHPEADRYVVSTDGTIRRDLMDYARISNEWFDIANRLGDEDLKNHFGPQECQAIYDEAMQGQEQKIAYCASYWFTGFSVKATITDGRANTIEREGATIPQLIAIARMLDALV